jgi:hypothetical protein
MFLIKINQIQSFIYSIYYISSNFIIHSIPIYYYFNYILIIKSSISQIHKSACLTQQSTIFTLLFSLFYIFIKNSSNFKLSSEKNSYKLNTLLKNYYIFSDVINKTNSIRSLWHETLYKKKTTIHTSSRLSLK